MSDVLTIAGSPSHTSRSALVLAHLREALEQQGLSTDTLHVRDLPAEALLWARVDDPTIQKAIQQVQRARAVIIGTPVYKAAYSGILKTFLDLLPQDALAGKITLPIATAGSPAHYLAIDYALKPVLSALGGEHILSGVYLFDKEIAVANGRIESFEAKSQGRLNAALEELIRQLTRQLTREQALVSISDKIA